MTLWQWLIVIGAGVVGFAAVTFVLNRNRREHVRRPDEPRGAGEE